MTRQTLAAAVAVIALLAGGLTQSVQAQDKTVAKPAGNTVPYSEGAKSSFMGSCVPDGGEAYCSCVLRKMEKDIPILDLVAYIDAVNAGQHHPLEPAINGMMKSCSDDPNS